MGYWNDTCDQIHSVCASDNNWYCNVCGAGQYSKGLHSHDIVHRVISLNNAVCMDAHLVSTSYFDKQGWDSMLTGVNLHSHKLFLLPFCLFEYPANVSVLFHQSLVLSFVHLKILSRQPQ